MKPNQLAALKKLEASLLAVKRAGLVLCGIDNSLHATVADGSFEETAASSSACEAMLARANDSHSLYREIKHYGSYRDSGGA